VVVKNPCDWVVDRLKTGRSFFTVRINDGEMIQMYRTRPEGSLLGTSANPAYTHYELGDAYRSMLEEIAVSDHKDDILIGCSWNTPRADDLCQHFEKDVHRLGLEDANWCNEHWPLDGVIDGSTIRMLEEVKGRFKSVLVTCPALTVARYVTSSASVVCSASDSWLQRGEVQEAGAWYAERGFTFLWVAGCGLKPTAWKLFKKYPQSSHIDVGHLFNGALGLRDYGWLQRKDGPWYEPYFRDFAPWVNSFIH
jgi:hypothetical protein